MKRLAAGAALVIAALGATDEAAARSSGMAAEGCSGCHGGGAIPTINISVSPATPAPGTPVTLTVSVSAPGAKVAGFYLRTNGKGALGPIANEGTRLVDGTQMVHSQPKTAVNGESRFSARYTAPSNPGGVIVEVWGVAANGNGRSSEDGSASARTSFAVGCAGKTYHRDFDGDGFGGDETVIDCVKPAGFADRGGDCDDNDSSTYPGAPELCNRRDDNCNQEVDENLAVSTQYEDADGDGYGKINGKTITEKCPPVGYAPVSGDCDDSNPAIHPGVTETCNNRDDNCDGRVDERVRPVCGIGMCARAAPVCDPGSCVAGDPKTETCNGLDDDCDGAVDEGDLCGPGRTCRDSECVVGSPSEGASDPSASDSNSGGCAVGSSSSRWPASVGLALVFVWLGRNRLATARRM